MKKKFKIFTGLALISMLALFAFVHKGGQGISGKFRNLEAGKHQYIYLFEQLGTEYRKVDSTIIKSDQFAFRFKNKLPRGFYKVGPEQENAAHIILSDESVVIDADASKLPEGYTTSGSRENAAYSDFRKYNNSQQGAFQQLNTEAQQAEQTFANDQEGYNNKIRSLQKRLDSINRERMIYYSAFQKANKGLFMEKYVNSIAVDTLPKDKFFRDSDFKDPEIARTDILPSKISVYMQKFVPQQLEDWKAESDAILARATLSNLNKEVLYITIIRNMANNDMEYTRAVAKRYLAEFPGSEFAKHFWEILPKDAPAIGEDAPDIRLTSPEGKSIALSSLKGKVVLLDFWASWCGPCRRENPNVVKAYQKYKEKGFTVFSVSLDTEKDRWLKAIQADGLVWESHVSDLQGWQSAAAKQYGVKGIPNTFLLDKAGKVVAVNLRGESLEEKLAELLK